MNWRRCAAGSETRYPRAAGRCRPMRSFCAMILVGPVSIGISATAQPRSPKSWLRHPVCSSRPPCKPISIGSTCFVANRGAKRCRRPASNACPSAASLSQTWRGRWFGVAPKYADRKRWSAKEPIAFPSSCITAWLRTDHRVGALSDAACSLRGANAMVAESRLLRNLRAAIG